MQATQRPLFGRRCAEAAQSAGRRLAPRRAALWLDAVSDHLRQEATLEGVLHVSVAQTCSCLGRFNDADVFQQAPPLHSLEEVLTAAAAATAAGDVGDSAQQLTEALCLATPEEAADSSGPLQPSLVRLVPPRTAANPAPPGSRSMPRAPIADGQIEQIIEEGEEGTAAAYQFQYTYARIALQDHVEEVMQASHATRRRRWRALIRLLRKGRSAVASINSSLASRDGEGWGASEWASMHVTGLPPGGL